MLPEPFLDRRLGGPPLRRGEAVGVVIGALVGAWPTFEGGRMFPYIGGGQNPAATPVGLIFAGGAVVLVALVLVGLVGRAGWVRLGVLVVGSLLAAVGLLVLLLLWTSGEALGLKSLAGDEQRIGPGAVLSLAGPVLVLGSVTVGPNLAAVLIGDAMVLAALLLPQAPDGQLGIVDPTVVAPLAAWLIAAVAATTWQARGGGQPIGALLGLFLVAFAILYPFLVGFAGTGGPSLVPVPRGQVDWRDVIALALLGFWWVGVGIAISGQPDRRRSRP